MSGKCDDCASSASGQVRVDDLSFYSSSAVPSYTLAKEEPGMVQENVKVVREGVMEGVNLITQAMDTVNRVMDTGVAHSTAAYNQLTEEENLPVRVGIIAGSGLMGLMVGSLRGRLMKRLVYTMVGAGGAAAVCYPEQAREGGEMVYQEGRKNVMVAYNTIAGVETVPTPSLPSLTDISSMATTTDMSLIAATMSKVLYAVARKLKDVYQLGQQKVAVLMDQGQYEVAFATEMMKENDDDKTKDDNAADAFATPEIAVVTANTEAANEDKLA